MHAQFELLRPFKDGNGRIGRLLIPLFLFQKKKLAQPMFYLSAYFESNREEYCDALGQISLRNAWNEWIVFFLRAVASQAQNNIGKVNEIRGLYERMKTLIQQTTHSQHTIQVLDAIFTRPVFRTSDFIAEAGILKATAMTLLRQLKAEKILRELPPGGGQTLHKIFPGSPRPVAEVESSFCRVAGDGNKISRRPPNRSYFPVFRFAIPSGLH